MQIRAKEKTKRSNKRRALLTAVILAGLTLVGAGVFFAAYSDKFSVFASTTVEITSSGKIIRVPSGGDLQAALNKAESGDVIELAAGGVYNAIELPKKALNDFITIRSSAYSQLPAGKRVKPEQAGSMAKIVTRSSDPAVNARDGANHFRFIGIEFTGDTSDYIYNILLLGNDQSPTNVPSNIEIDRSYIHPSSKGISRRGIAINSAQTIIQNSYISGFGFPGEETQAICGWTGTRDIKILNNYLEGGAENVLFGGSDPASAELTPTNIELRGNFFNKPASWIGNATLKCLFELKNAKNVTVIGNVFSNNYVGSAFRITVRDQNGKATFSTIEDVIISDNVIKNAGEGINILGKDDTYPSQTLKRLRIVNNLMVNLKGGNGFEGDGYLFQISDGEDIRILNNTGLNSGSAFKFHGTLPRGLIVRDNIAGHGPYGIVGIDNKLSTSRAMFQNNLFINNMKILPDDYNFPSGNILVQSIDNIGFTDPKKGNYQLAESSKYLRSGVSGGRIGADIARINAAVAGVEQ